MRIVMIWTAGQCEFSANHHENLKKKTLEKHARPLGDQYRSLYNKLELNEETFSIIIDWIDEHVYKLRALPSSYALQR